MAEAITNCPHPDRKHHARGMCKSCANAIIAKENAKPATHCRHTDRPAHGRGKCQECARKESTVMATCHPDRPHKANGLCKSCHNAAWVRKKKGGVMATCHPERLAMDSGLCINCHRVSFTTPSRMADCHPERVHKANGLCAACFNRENTNSKKSQCHPEKPHYANGLCELCYRKELPPNSIMATCHPKKPHYSRGYCQKCALKNDYLRRTHKITLSQYLTKLASTGGKCEICRRPLLSGLEEDHDKRNIACIDHCHKTGKIRGILCHECNKGIGYLKESQENLKRASAYLLK